LVPHREDDEHCQCGCRDEPDPPIVLARVVETCAACPNQWDAWTTSGQYLYLRYRSGIGTVDAYDAPGPDGWTVPPDGRTARFEDCDEPPAIDIELDEFLERTGLRLASDAVVVS
jgi:hypothetical protein